MGFDLLGECSQERVYGEGGEAKQEYELSLRTTSRYLYRKRTKGGKKMHTCKSKLILMLYSGKKRLKKNKP